MLDISFLYKFLHALQHFHLNLAIGDYKSEEFGFEFEKTISLFLLCECFLLLASYVGLPASAFLYRHDPFVVYVVCLTKIVGADVVGIVSVFLAGLQHLDVVTP